MIAMRYYVHHTPGRLRIKIPQIKHRPYRAKSVHDLLSGHGGLDRVEVNTATGSVVVYYNPEAISCDQILNLLKYNDLFDESQVMSEEEYRSRTSAKAGQALGKAVLGWAMGRVLDASGLSFLAALI
jgi:hypothetical protein